MAEIEQDRAESESDLQRIEVQGNTNALSRTIAVMVLMILPGVGGYYLDKWAGTQVFVLLGFLLGICVAVFGMLYVAKIADETARRNRLRRKELEDRAQSGS